MGIYKYYCDECGAHHCDCHKRVLKPGDPTLYGPFGFDWEAFDEAKKNPKIKAINKRNKEFWEERVKSDVKSKPTGDIISDVGFWLAIGINGVGLVIGCVAIVLSLLGVLK